MRLYAPFFGEGGKEKVTDRRIKVALMAHAEAPTMTANSAQWDFGHPHRTLNTVKQCGASP
jgi:hypothetical protein